MNTFLLLNSPRVRMRCDMARIADTMHPRTLAHTRALIESAGVRCVAEERMRDGSDTRIESARAVEQPLTKGTG